MINVCTLPSSQINRQVDELRYRRVPLTFRRFADPFKVPDNTALLQAILLAQTGQTSAIPNVISSTSNDAFSASINSLRPIPVVLNHEGINHAEANMPTIPVNPTTPADVKIPLERKDDTVQFGQKQGSLSSLTDVNPPAPLTGKIGSNTMSFGSKQGGLVNLLETRNALNVKEKLNLGHIKQNTSIPVNLHVKQQEHKVRTMINKKTLLENEIRSFNAQFLGSNEQTRQSLKKRIMAHKATVTKLDQAISNENSLTTKLKKMESPVDTGAIEKKKKPNRFQKSLRGKGGR